MERELSQKKSSWKALCILLLPAIIFATAIAGYAALPVYDAKVDLTLSKNFIETIANLVNQLKQLRATQQYYELIDGKWYDPLAIADIIKARGAALGIPVDKLGLENVTKYKNVSGTRAAGLALEDLRKIVQGQAEMKNYGGLRTDIELIHGIAPATTAGVKVDAAYDQMTQVAAMSGEINKAIVEVQKQIKEITDEINSGDLAPGDLNRLNVLLQAKRSDLDALQIQVANQQNLLTMHQLGMSAAQEVRTENGRLQQRYEILSMKPIFTPMLQGEQEAEE